MTTARIGLVSDSHGRFSCLEQMVDQAPDVCCWIHGGDYCNDAEDLAAWRRARTAYLCPSSVIMTT